MYWIQYYQDEDCFVEKLVRY